jgi:hypothetical protein
MRDPMFLILKSLNLLLVRLTRIFVFIFSNYFPSPTPEEPENDGFLDFIK